MYQISLRQEDGAAEDDEGRRCPNLLVEGVETCSGQDKTTDIRQEGKQVDGQRDASFATIANQEFNGSLFGR